MKRNILMVAMMFAASTLFAADAKDTAAAAAKKLADSGSYSWKQTLDMGAGGFGGGGPMVSEGKTQNGVAWTSMQMMDNTIERLSKGTNSLTKTEGKWLTPAEAAAARGDGGGGPGGPGGGRRGGGMFGGATVLPATTAQELVGLTQSLKEENGVISGDLTEAGAKSQLSFGRRGGRGGGGPGGGTPPEPTNAKGSVKFWVKDGVLSKYELKNSGTMTFGDNEMQIDRTTTVEFSNVGSTKIDAPEEALKKIGG